MDTAMGRPRAPSPTLAARVPWAASPFPLPGGNGPSVTDRITTAVSSLELARPAPTHLFPRHSQATLEPMVHEGGREMDVLERGELSGAAAPGRQA
jgi:hypothetical protein